MGPKEMRPNLEKYYTPEGILKDEDGDGDLFGGEAATPRELKNFKGDIGDRGFAPKDPKQAAEYYKNKIISTLRSPGYKQGETLELFRYYNGKLLDIYATNPELENIMQNRQKYKDTFASKFMENFERNLLSVLQKEHYQLLPGMIIGTSKGFSDAFGYDFNLTVTSVADNEYSFYLKDNDIKKHFIGKITADLSDNNITINLLPTIDPNNSKDFNPNYVPQTIEKIKGLMGMVYLLRIPEYKNKLYQGGRNPDKEGFLGDTAPTDVGKEIKDVMVPFRRRTVDNVDDAWVEATELIDSLNKDMKKTIEKNLGSLSFAIHYVNYSNDKNARWSEAMQRHILDAGKIGVCTYNNRAELENLIQMALIKGSKAIISMEGGYVPPELMDQPAGSAKRPHVRRTKQVILVMGREFKGEEYIKIRILFKNKQKGEKLSMEEENTLNKFLEEYRIDDPFAISFETVKKDGVFFTDASYHAGSSHKGGAKNGKVIRGGNYTIRPSKQIAS